MNLKIHLIFLQVWDEPSDLMKIFQHYQLTNKKTPHILQKKYI